jgi:hypothetical protein
MQARNLQSSTYAGWHGIAARRILQGGSSVQNNPQYQWDQQDPNAQTPDPMALDPEEEQRVAQQAERDESGRPGGGVGRIDVPGHTGVYPLSADEGASPEAMVEPEQAWGQGERGATGYQDSGESEIFPPDELRETGDEITGDEVMR